MIEAGAAVIAEKCETGPYWARAVAKDVWIVIPICGGKPVRCIAWACLTRPETDH